jgi:hypothetical protein
MQGSLIRGKRSHSFSHNTDEIVVFLPQVIVIENTIRLLDRFQGLACFFIRNERVKGLTSRGIGTAQTNIRLAYLKATGLGRYIQQLVKGLSA